MTEKCNKYDSIFTFSDEQTLVEHLAVCEDCRAEHEKMLKVSNLIKEVKPKFKKSRFTKAKVACLLFILMLGGLSIEFADQQYGFLDTVKYGQQLSLKDLGIPTDNYGLIVVD